MELEICLLPGDGIGPEVVREGVKVLKAVAQKFGHTLKLEEAFIGGAAIDKYGEPLPAETLKKCKECKAILLGAVGGPKWDNNPPELRPEKGLLAIRKELGLFANLRPVKLIPQLQESSVLRKDIVEKGIDLLVVRELTGGIYFGTPKGIFEEQGQLVGINTMRYTEAEVERIVRLAFELALKRKKKLTSVDKANVLEVSRLWRQVVEKVKVDYPEVEVEHLYVDNAAMQLVSRPYSFDVLVTGNLFGDILSDEAGVITGSLGTLPSASLGKEFGLYEPIHGSAPDIAGQDMANPIATIMSVAMLLEYSFNLSEEAGAIYRAVEQTLGFGYRTKDILRPGLKKVSCSQMGDFIAMQV
ncbi:MAG: 3-isopropylmalate dehydrogenase [Desulfonauticus sp.]|jgi:3-isopropylmalate dehydrogenase|nr:MAG: 3-isopropylmalate dehydrogenase [Desulfonauticus sp. 38_4375]MDK2921114.1 3-isopropylmalate dehydrogenase [Desulfonauticus sp.]